MKALRSLFAVCVIVLTGLASCSKTGDTGPAGPVGPAGPDSVYSSPWISLNAGLDDNSDYVDSIQAPTVTKGILDSGVILSYVNLAGPDGIYHVVPLSGLESIQFYDDYSIGQINLFATSDFTGVPYRYVTIPGSKTVGNGANRKYNGYTITELKSMSYDMVQQVVANQ